MAQMTPESFPYQSIDQQLPPDVAQLAQNHQLGSFLKVFPTDQKSLRTATIVAVVIMVFAVFLMVMDIMSHSGAAIELVILISGGLFLVRAIFGRDRAVYLFQNGIIYKKGAGYEAVLWQQIKKLKLRKRFLVDPAWFRMQTTDSRRASFTYLENPEELYAAVEQGHRYSQQFPRQ
jgi:hypothetical protein